VLTLDTTLYRKYAGANGLSLQPRLVLQRKDGEGRAEFMNPHYDPEFDREFLFSRLKCLEIAVEPGLNLLDHPAVGTFGFYHDEGCARAVTKQVGGPTALFPPDKFGDVVEVHRLDSYVTRDSIELFLQDVPPERTDGRRDQLHEVLGSSIEIHD
jgi:hypothetical protein